MQLRGVAEAGAPKGNGDVVTELNTVPLVLLQKLARRKAMETRFSCALVKIIQLVAEAGAPKGNGDILATLLLALKTEVAEAGAPKGNGDLVDVDHNGLASLKLQKLARRKAMETSTHCCC